MTSDSSHDLQHSHIRLHSPTGDENSARDSNRDQQDPATSSEEEHNKLNQQLDVEAILTEMAEETETVNSEDLSQLSTSEVVERIERQEKLIQQYELELTQIGVKLLFDSVVNRMNKVRQVGKHNTKTSQGSPSETGKTKSPLSTDLQGVLEFLSTSIDRIDEQLQVATAASSSMQHRDKAIQIVARFRKNILELNALLNTIDESLIEKDAPSQSNENRFAA